MHPIIAKTFGGLSKEYYFRQFFFGLLCSAFVIYMASQGKNPGAIGQYFFALLCAFLYPYSRFVYESIVGFIMGENVFFMNMFVLLIFKVFTMLMCWAFSIIIAPVGLAYLYYHHSKNN